MISTEEDCDVKFHIPSPKLTTLGVTHNFKVPFPGAEFWTATKQKDEDEDQDASAGFEDEDEADEEPVQLTLTAGAVGRVVPQRQKFLITHENGDENELSVS